MEKPKPNRRIYIETLRGMTPEQRLLKAFELSEMAKELFAAGLRARFADLDEDRFHDLYLRRLEKCHNKNW